MGEVDMEDTEDEHWYRPSKVSVETLRGQYGQRLFRGLNFLLAQLKVARVDDSR